MEWSDLGKYDGNMNHTQSGEQDILECKGWNILVYMYYRRRGCFVVTFVVNIILICMS